MLEHRQKKNSFEWCPRHERRRRRAPSDVPFIEIFIRKSPLLLGEHVRVAVRAGVVRDARREIRQAAADVEDLAAAREVRERGLQPRVAHAPRQEAVEGAVFAHVPWF